MALIMADLGYGLVAAFCHEMRAGCAEDEYFFECLDLQKIKFNDTSRIWIAQSNQKRYTKELQSQLKKYGIKEIAVGGANRTLTVKSKKTIKESNIHHFNNGTNTISYKK